MAGYCQQQWNEPFSQVLLLVYHCKLSCLLGVSKVQPASAMPATLEHTIVPGLTSYKNPPTLWADKIAFPLEC